MKHHLPSNDEVVDLSPLLEAALLEAALVVPHRDRATADDPSCTWCSEPRSEGSHTGCHAGRLEALARSAFEYAETLNDEDLANLYSGKALGLIQAARMLRSELGHGELLSCRDCGCFISGHEVAA